ncbi:MAG: hypothetical protein ACRD2A_22625 [Vicinamibacterales bacterium]
MKRGDIISFAHRDWSRIAASKARAWQSEQRSPAEDLRVADQLRRYVRRVRPDWPSASDRAGDLACHRRVSRALGAVTL